MVVSRKSRSLKRSIYIFFLADIDWRKKEKSWKLKKN